jgi:hypothetical protein
MQASSAWGKVNQVQRLEQSWVEVQRQQEEHRRNIEAAREAKKARDIQIAREKAEKEKVRLDTLAMVNSSYSGQVCTKQNICALLRKHAIGDSMIDVLFDITGEYIEPETDEHHNDLDQSQMICGVKYGIWHYYTRCGYFNTNGNCGHNKHDGNDCTNLLAHVIHEVPTHDGEKVNQRAYAVVYRYKRTDNDITKHGIIRGYVDAMNYTISYGSRRFNAKFFGMESLEVESPNR